MKPQACVAHESTEHHSTIASNCSLGLAIYTACNMMCHSNQTSTFFTKCHVCLLLD